MRSVVASLFLILGALASATALADSTADLTQMQKSFSAVKSVHADMHLPDGKTIAMDVVFPDKFHETMFNGMQTIIIGSDIWMNPSGKQWMKLPGMMGPMQSYMSTVRTAGLKGEAAKNFTITDLGPAMLGTVPAHRYRIVGQDKTPVDMWIGAGHLPLQVQVPSAKGMMIIDYSNYNSVPDITPPM